MRNALKINPFELEKQGWVERGFPFELVPRKASVNLTEIEWPCQVVPFEARGPIFITVY